MIARPPYVAESIRAATRARLAELALATILTALVMVTYYFAFIGTAKGAEACAYDNNGRVVCMGPLLQQPKQAKARQVASDANGNIIAVLGGRCAACAGKPETRNLYCGCCLSDYLFGRVIETPNLKLAWTWAQVFRRTHAAPGAVAVNRRHVVLLVEHVGGTIWTVRSYNDYRHLSYIVNRDVRGYVFIDPHSRTAAR